MRMKSEKQIRKENEAQIRMIIYDEVAPTIEDFMQQKKQQDNRLWVPVEDVLAYFQGADESELCKEPHSRLQNLVAELSEAMMRKATQEAEDDV